MQETHKSSAMAIANWFIERSGYSCDQMKLYKLVYFAHAWYLGNCGQELFPEDVQAWQHGPVIPALYSQFRRFGRDKISVLGSRVTVSPQGDFLTETPRHDGTLKDFLENLWQKYGHFSGIQLSNATHLEGEPWTIVAQEYNFELSGKPTIPTEIIRKVFAGKVEAA